MTNLKSPTGDTPPIACSQRTSGSCLSVRQGEVLSQSAGVPDQWKSGLNGSLCQPRRAVSSASVTSIAGVDARKRGSER